MKKYSVRKYFYVDTLIDANDPEEANDLVNEMDISLSDAEYLGDLEFECPDVAEV